MRRPVRPYLRKLGTSTVLLTFLTIAIVGFSQTKTFRSYLREVVLETLNNAIVADVSFGRIRGNLFTRVTLDSLRLSRSGHDIVFAPEAEIRYNPLILLIDQPIIRRITLVNPVVSMWRSKSGEWNTDGLIAASEPDTTAGESELNLRLIEIQNGSFTMIDSAAIAARDTLDDFTLPPNAVDFARIGLRNVNVVASVLVQPENLDVGISEFSFRSPSPRFALETIQGRITVAPSGASIRDFALRTRTTDLHLDASLQGADIFALSSLEDLAEADVRLSLSAEKFNLAELRQFLPEPLFFLDEVVGLNVEASGTFARLSVSDVTLDMAPTKLKLDGTIMNLHRPEFLQLDVKSDEGLLTSDEIRQRLPGLKLPDLALLGPLQTTLSFAGTPLVFHAHVIVESDRGSAEADASLDLRSDEIEYDVEATTRRLDLAALMGSDYIQSRLNGSVAIRGAGTNPRTMAATVRAEIDTSAFRGMPIDKSVAVIDASGGQVRYHLILAPGPTRADVSGTLTYTPTPDSIVYVSEGTVSSLNLADFIPSPRFNSDLNFKIRTEGTGLKADRMKNSLTIEFQPSLYQEEPFDHGTVQLDYDSYTRARQSLHLTSNIIDANVRGHFTAGSLTRVLAATGERFARGISLRSEHLDSVSSSSRTASINYADHPLRDDLSDTLAADVSIDVKDFYALGLVAGQQLAGYGTLSGFLRSMDGDISFSGIFDLPEFLSMRASEDLYLSGAELEFDIAGLDNVHPLDSAQVTVDLRVEHAETGAIALDSLGATAFFSGDSLRLDLHGLYDSLATIETNAIAVYRRGLLDVSIFDLQCDFAAFDLQNSEPLRFLVAQDGIHLTQFVLTNDEEEIRASGVVNPGGESDLKVEVNNLLLGNLKYLSRNPVFRTATNDLNGIVTFNASFTGSVDDPRYKLDLNARGVRIGNAILGQVEARNSYESGIATVFLEFRNRPKSLLTSPDLLLSGTIPLKRPSEGDVGAQRMDLTLRSQNLTIGFLDPFLPFLTNLSGRLQGEMKVGGTLDAPTYDGSLSLDDIEFRFVPLDLPYRLSGKLVPQGEQIALRDVELRNLPLNQNQPGIRLSGALTLEGIAIKSFDMTAIGELQLMSSRSSRQPGSLYGDLTGSMADPGIHWYGTPGESFVTGEIYLRRTNLTLPPTRASIADRERRISITFVDDTTTARPDSSTEAIAEARISTLRNDAERNGSDRNGGRAGLAGIRDTAAAESAVRERSFLDNASYNLTIESTESSILTIVVNPLTNERLTAYLTGRLVFLQDQNRTRLTGEVTLGEGSFYNYIRQFQATGRLLFTGDPENPELDITATYEDFHMVESASTSPDSLNVSVPDEHVTITMRIQGERREPKVSIDLQRLRPDGQTIVSQDPQSDAISFLVSGKFRDELTPQERTSLLTTSLAGIGSSILSGPLTEFMRRELGFISSVDVLYYGGNIQERTDIRVSGKIGDAVIRFGGRVFSDLGNANVNVQLPMSSIIGSESWRNFVFELERRVDEFESANQRPEPTNSAKILYRIIF